MRLSIDNDGGLEISLDDDGRVTIQNATDRAVTISRVELHWLMVAAGPAILCNKVRDPGTAAAGVATDQATGPGDGQTTLDDFAIANQETK